MTHPDALPEAVEASKLRAQGIEISACPFCRTTEHLSTIAVGSLTGDMPGRPYQVVCHHLECEGVRGPVGYGRPAAIELWNCRVLVPAAETETFETAAAAAWDFVRSKLPELNREKGPAGVWSNGFRSGWSAATRVSPVPVDKGAIGEEASETSIWTGPVADNSTPECLEAFVDWMGRGFDLSPYRGYSNMQRFKHSHIQSTWEGFVAAWNLRALSTREATPLEADPSELVEFFRGEGYSDFGWHGDAERWSTEHTAVMAMRELIALKRTLSTATPLEPSEAEIEAAARAFATDYFKRQFIADAGHPLVTRNVADNYQNFTDAARAALLAARRPIHTDSKGY